MREGFGLEGGGGGGEGESKLGALDVFRFFRKKIY